jgi:hypothetical protein
MNPSPVSLSSSRYISSLISHSSCQHLLPCLLCCVGPRLPYHKAQHCRRTWSKSTGRLSSAAQITSSSRLLTLTGQNPFRLNKPCSACQSTPLRLSHAPKQAIGQWKCKIGCHGSSNHHAAVPRHITLPSNSRFLNPSEVSASVALLQEGPSLSRVPIRLLR